MRKFSRVPDSDCYIYPHCYSAFRIFVASNNVVGICTFLIILLGRRSVKIRSSIVSICCFRGEGAEERCFEGIRDKGRS